MPTKKVETLFTSNDESSGDDVIDVTPPAPTNSSQLVTPTLDFTPSEIAMMEPVDVINVVLGLPTAAPLDSPTDAQRLMEANKWVETTLEPIIVKLIKNVVDMVWPPEVRVSRQSFKYSEYEDVACEYVAKFRERMRTLYRTSKIHGHKTMASEMNGLWSSSTNKNAVKWALVAHAPDWFATVERHRAFRTGGVHTTPSQENESKITSLDEARKLIRKSVKTISFVLEVENPAKFAGKQGSRLAHLRRMYHLTLAFIGPKSQPRDLKVSAYTWDDVADMIKDPKFATGYGQGDFIVVKSPTGAATTLTIATKEDLVVALAEVRNLWKLVNV